MFRGSTLLLYCFYVLLFLCFYAPVLYHEPMTSLVPFFIILVAGLIFSEMFNRLHLPYVVALIIAGIIIGPSGFGLVEINETWDLLGLSF